VGVHLLRKVRLGTEPTIRVERRNGIHSGANVIKLFMVVSYALS
jgi:hypothetical protein